MRELGTGDVADIVQETNGVLLRYLSQNVRRKDIDHQTTFTCQVVSIHFRTQCKTYRDHVLFTACLTCDNGLGCVAVFEGTLVDSISHCTCTGFTVTAVLATSGKNESRTVRTNRRNNSQPAKRMHLELLILTSHPPRGHSFQSESLGCLHRTCTTYH